MKYSQFLPAIVPFLGILFSDCEKINNHKSSNPNIIYIYADDLGIGDIGCYGQKHIQTPNIDQMAKEGIVFTQHYSGAPVCAPARCSLLTGRHAGNSYVRNNMEIPDSSVFKAGQLPLPDEAITIAEVLKQRGYATAIVGKWGLGGIESTGNPNKQGFDFFYGYADQVHAHNHFPEFLWRNGEQEYLGNSVQTVHPKFNQLFENSASEEYQKYVGSKYSLDIMTEEAIRFINMNQKTPFFLYLPYVVPHKALQVPEESLELYDGIFNEVAYVGEKGYTPHPRPLSAYAAMITRMDQRIGEILKHLKDIGLDDNTLVMFSSDNGPANGGGLSPQFFDSSAGLRGGKGLLYEGGIRVPFIARWPSKIPAGKKTDHISAQYDLMATLGELVGLNVPTNDGVSFLQTLLGKEELQKDHEFLYWEYSVGEQQAVRIGDWKGVRKRIGGNSEFHLELYNLKIDEGEIENVSEAHPELIEKLEKIMASRTPSHIDVWNF